MARSFLIFVFSAVAVLTTVAGQSLNTSTNKVANGTQDYFKLSQTQLLYQIKIAEMENDAIKVRFKDRLDVIALEQQKVLNETQQVNQTIKPLQALNVLRKYCIQTYDSQFVTHERAEDQYNVCMRNAQNAGYGLTMYATTYTNSAKQYTLTTFPRNVDSCTYYNKTQTKVEQCYIDYVEAAVAYVQSNLEKAQAAREQSIFNMKGISLTAVQCSFSISKAVLETISYTLKKINDCVERSGKLH